MYAREISVSAFALCAGVGVLVCVVCVCMSEFCIVLCWCDGRCENCYIYNRNANVVNRTEICWWNSGKTQAIVFVCG